MILDKRRILKGDLQKKNLYGAVTIANVHLITSPSQRFVPDGIFPLSCVVPTSQ